MRWLVNVAGNNAGAQHCDGEEAEQVAAFAAISRADELRKLATDQERVLIDSQMLRYSETPAEDRNPFDLAYADALGELYERYPEDDDIASKFAEGWTNTMPWDYWSDGETPRPETVPVIEALESILARNAERLLALHLYIHAVEASSNPGRAEVAEVDEECIAACNFYVLIGKLTSCNLTGTT